LTRPTESTARCRRASLTGSGARNWPVWVAYSDERRSDGGGGGSLKSIMPCW